MYPARMASEEQEGATRRGSREQERRYVMIHCPTGEPGPPYEVIGNDHVPLARFETLAEAQAFAETEAAKYEATVILSPLARGYM